MQSAFSLGSIVVVVVLECCAEGSLDKEERIFSELAHNDTPADTS